MSLLPNPWDGPKPKSVEQLGLLVTLQSFLNARKRCHTGSYPYELMKDKPDRLPYFEILGDGPPPTDFSGNPGDIYIDTEGECPVIYIRDLQGWQAWNERPGPDGTAKRVLLAPHPLLVDRYLWKTQSSFSMTWLTEGTLRLLGISPKTVKFDPTKDILSISRYTRGGTIRMPSQSVSRVIVKSLPISKKRKLESLNSSSRVPMGDQDRVMEDDEDDEEVVVMKNPQDSNRDDAISAKANMLSDFIMEAEDARRTAEVRVSKLHARLTEARTALHDAEIKIAAIEGKSLAISEQCQEERKQREDVEEKLNSALSQIAILKDNLQQKETIIVDTERKLEEVSKNFAAKETLLRQYKAKVRELDQLEVEH